MRDPKTINPTTPLQKALMEVCKMSFGGATPAQCAVVYRSLAKEYPNTPWLSFYAEKWDEMGEKWKPMDWKNHPEWPISSDEQEPVKPGNLGRLLSAAKPLEQIEIDLEVKRQLDAYKAQAPGGSSLATS